MAKSDVDGFWSAANHLPAERFDPSTVIGYRAWLAARLHDTEHAMRKLANLIELEPGNVNVLERLAVLKLESGHPDVAAVPPSSQSRGGPRSG